MRCCFQTRGLQRNLQLSFHRLSWKGQFFPNSFKRNIKTIQARDTSKFWEQNWISFVIFLGWKRACWCWQITNEIPPQSDKECKSGPVRYRYSDCNRTVGIRCSDQKATCFTASLIMLLCQCIKHLSMQQQITEPRAHDCIICLRFVLPWALKRVSYLNTVFTTSRQRRGFGRSVTHVCSW